MYFAPGVLEDHLSDTVCCVLPQVTAAFHAFKVGFGSELVFVAVARAEQIIQFLGMNIVCNRFSIIYYLL